MNENLKRGHSLSFSADHADLHRTYLLPYHLLSWPMGETQPPQLHRTSDPTQSAFLLNSGVLSVPMRHRQYRIFVQQSGIAIT